MVSEGNEISRISRQFLREYPATVTRPQSAAVSMDVTLDHVAQLEDRPSVTNTLATLYRDVPVAGKQVRDANIVARPRRAAPLDVQRRRFPALRRTDRAGGHGGRGMNAEAGGRGQASGRGRAGGAAREYCRPLA